MRLHRVRYPRDMRAQEVTAPLNHLARDRRVAAASPNQELAALLFLYKHLCHVKLSWLDGLVRAKTATGLPIPRARCAFFAQ
jgi:hypothetical protein